MPTVTGSVIRTAAQKGSEQVSVLDFGAKGDGATNDTTAINAAIAYCVSLGKVCSFPAKTYLVSNLATLTGNNTMLVGEPGARLKFTGSGVGIPIDGTSFGGTRVIIRELILDGNSTMTYCIDALFMVGGELRNVRCTNCTAAAVRLRNCVLNTVANLVVSSNVQAFVTKPVSGIVLDQGTAGSPCGGNTLLNLRIEGVSGPGIDIASAITTTIMGGSSEGNGTGMITRAGTSKTTVLGLDFEANSVCDVDIAGQMADFYDCDCSSNASVIIRSTGSLNHFYGGYYVQITINTGGQYNAFDRLSIVNPITDNGDHNVFNGLFNTSSQANIADKKWADQILNGFNLINAGKIGIGVTPSTYKLDVAGDCNLSAGSVYRINGTPISAAAGSGPAVSAYMSGTSPLFLMGVATAVPFNVTEFDSSGGSMHSNTVNNTRLTAPSTGYYMLIANHQFASGATGTVAKFTVNGADVIGSQTQAVITAFVAITATAVVHLNANDYVEYFITAVTADAAVITFTDAPRGAARFQLIRLF